MLYLWECLDDLITEKFSNLNNRQSDPCVVNAKAGKRDSRFLMDTSCDHITWASGQADITTNATQTTNQGLPVHTGHWKTKGEGRVFNLVQLLLSGCCLLLCWSQCSQMEMCPAQWRLLAGSLAHSGSSLGHIDIVEALQQLMFMQLSLIRKS